MRFGKRRRLALYRNRSPLMRREGAALLGSRCTNPRKELVYIDIYVEIYCLKGASSSPRLFRLVISYTAGARNSGDRPEAGTGWELGVINLNVHFFFLPVREFFVLHRMVGSIQRGVLTPGYFERCNFPSV